MDRKQAKICPGQKFVTNEYPRMTRWPGSLCTCRFRKPTHRPLEPQNIRKNMEQHSLSRFFYLFAGLDTLLFFLRTLSLLTRSLLWLLSPLLLHLSISRKYEIETSFDHIYIEWYWGSAAMPCCHWSADDLSLDELVLMLERQPPLSSGLDTRPGMRTADPIYLRVNI